MHRCVGVVCLAAAIASVSGCKFRNEIEGTYVLTGVEIDGDKLSKKRLNELPDNERMVVIRPDKFGFYNFAWRTYETVPYKIDNSKIPAEIDLLPPDREDQKKEQAILGIYKLDGDVLTICFTPSKARRPKKPADGAKGGRVEYEEVTYERPTEFKTSKDSPSMLLVLKVLREKR